jgi:DNA end-binding protein Ku
MKLVDESGHALGRQYHCSNDGKQLAQEDLVRGYETDSGKTVMITDAELDSVAPDLSSDIELRSFVPQGQIPPLYFQRSYFLAPAGKSAKAYHLLTATMQRTGRIGIGSFVMRGHEYLVAIVADHGVLRAATLHYADEIRLPKTLGLPKPGKPAAKQITQFSKAIDALIRDALSVAELEDTEARALHELAQSKQKQGKDVIQSPDLDSDDPEDPSSGGNIIDLMAVLRKSLSKSTVVTNVSSGPPISLAERRARKAGTRAAVGKKTPAKRKSQRHSR